MHGRGGVNVHDKCGAACPAAVIVCGRWRAAIAIGVKEKDTVAAPLMVRIKHAAGAEQLAALFVFLPAFP
jgi:hypothetical protein